MTIVSFLRSGPGVLILVLIGSAIIIGLAYLMGLPQCVHSGLRSRRLSADTIIPLTIIPPRRRSLPRRPPATHHRRTRLGRRYHPAPDESFWLKD